MTKLLTLLGTFLLLGHSQAFAPQTTRSSSSQRIQSSSSTALPAIRRRAAFSWLKKALLTGVGISTASKLEVASAEEATGGKIVTFTVDNLDGIPGNTGTVKIQLQPEWAPRGVERFEVRPVV